MHPKVAHLEDALVHSVLLLDERAFHQPPSPGAGVRDLVQTLAQHEQPEEKGTMITMGGMNHHHIWRSSAP